MIAPARLDLTHQRLRRSRRRFAGCEVVAAEGWQSVLMRLAVAACWCRMGCRAALFTGDVRRRRPRACAQRDASTDAGAWLLREAWAFGCYACRRED